MNGNTITSSTTTVSFSGPYSLGKPVEWKLEGHTLTFYSRQDVRPYSLGKPVEWKLWTLDFFVSETKDRPYSLGKPVEWKRLYALWSFLYYESLLARETS